MTVFQNMERRCIEKENRILPGGEVLRQKCRPPLDNMTKDSV